MGDGTHLLFALNFWRPSLSLFLPSLSSAAAVRACVVLECSEGLLWRLARLQHLPI